MVYTEKKKVEIWDNNDVITEWSLSFPRFVSVPTYCFMWNGVVVRSRVRKIVLEVPLKWRSNSPLCRKGILEPIAVYVYPCNQMQKETLVYSCMVWEETLQIIETIRAYWARVSGNKATWIIRNLASFSSLGTARVFNCCNNCWLYHH